jgi:hypothetical protein
MFLIVIKDHHSLWAFAGLYHALEEVSIICCEFRPRILNRSEFYCADISPNLFFRQSIAFQVLNFNVTQPQCIII